MKEAFYLVLSIPFYIPSAHCGVWCHFRIEHVCRKNGKNPQKWNAHLIYTQFYYNVISNTIYKEINRNINNKWIGKGRSNRVLMQKKNVNLNIIRDHYVETILKYWKWFGVFRLCLQIDIYAKKKIVVTIEKLRVKYKFGQIIEFYTTHFMTQSRHTLSFYSINWSLYKTCP